MADLYLKALEAERKSLWATCRLKGLARDTPERHRIEHAFILHCRAAHGVTLPRALGCGGANVAPGMRECNTLAIHDGDLPVFVMAVIRRERRHRHRGRAALRKQVRREPVVAR